MKKGTQNQVYFFAWHREERGIQPKNPYILLIDNSSK